MAKYHAFKTRKGDNPLATLRLWREDAERGYWEADDPHFLVNISPDILRSYQPGTGLAVPELPDLALKHGPLGTVEDDYTPDHLADVPPEAFTDTGTVGPRRKHRVQRRENMVENALRRDGTVLRYLSRPYLGWQVLAVQHTALAMEHVPARGRGTTVGDGTSEPTTAAHVTVQRAAFRAHPIALMLFPDKFDDELTRHEFAPRVLDFARDLADLYGRWALAGRLFDAAHQERIEEALREYATPGNGAIKTVPLLDLMRADKHAREYVKPALALHADPVDAARTVLDAAPWGGDVYTLPLPV